MHSRDTYSVVNIFKRDLSAFIIMHLRPLFTILQIRSLFKYLKLVIVKIEICM